MPGPFPGPLDWELLEDQLKRAQDEPAALLKAGRFYALWHREERTEQGARIRKDREEGVVWEGEDHTSFYREKSRAKAEEESKEAKPRSPLHRPVLEFSPLFPATTTTSSPPSEYF
jgi:hypothetical protein